jgi:hypothetical protein
VPNNVTFQTDVATPPADTVVGALEIDGVKYQKMLDAYDYVFYFYKSGGYGDGMIEYICRHPVYGTATSATDWRITKLEYGVNGITFKGTQSGSLDGRVALFGG